MFNQNNPFVNGHIKISDQKSKEKGAETSMSMHIPEELNSPPHEFELMTSFEKSLKKP